ncbi:ribosomal-protein-alanine N-acetyltransferase [Fontibacillus panacisegetis]|uniref:Ribosomal-protein-alanine N-acetyltransferase n=1 Tax=Fontibacillus panacisegetis TaxID=670482 RepID=A0A1G7P0M6_9BACL|nr:GNAT family N-acetyltransferase [Fontibacillus panacisegetis]SDF79667.1 ribosomal-protein-alanine N-acetyltransferase [Fontibacillus panacisegetis]
MKHHFQTDQVSLQVIDESYAQAVTEYNLRNKDFLKPWEPERNSDFYTVPYQENLLHEEYYKILEGSLYKVWIMMNEKIIGSIALSNIVMGVFQSCHLGYKLDEQEQGKGIMTESLRPIIDYAFQELSLHRIEANIMPRNKGSLRLVEKLGFQNEGLARKYLKINGVWEDHIHMVLLNEGEEA